MESELRVLALNGSLRAASYNGLLLREAETLAPPELTIRRFGLGEIPPYNADIELAGEPPSVAALRAEVSGAGALLIASPEYNYGVPGVLKNAIDWISRPPGSTPFRRKPVAIMGASTGQSGTMRMQIQLRTSLQSVEAYVMPKPEMVVAHCRDKFGSDGRLTDERTREHLRGFLAAMLDWCRRF